MIIQCDNIRHVDLRKIIRDELDRREITQMRLSEMTGITEPRISNYLTGERDVYAETLTRILTVLNLRIVPDKRRRRRKDR